MWSVDSQENTLKCCHQLSHSKAEMHQIRSRWGSSQRSPDSFPTKHSNRHSVKVSFGYSCCLMCSDVLWAPGAFSWLNASSSTASTVHLTCFSTAGFMINNVVWSIFFNRSFKDDRVQCLLGNSCTYFFSPYPFCYRNTLIKMCLL